jgi:hypothetical protein
MGDKCAKWSVSNTQPILPAHFKGSRCGSRTQPFSSPLKVDPFHLFSRHLLGESAARKTVQSFFQSWNGQAVLQTGQQKIEFHEQGAEFSDGTSAIFLNFRFTVVGPGADANTREQKPWLYHPYERTKLAAALVARFQEYIAGREKLPSMAYYCWTALEEQYGSESAVATALSVSRNVLAQLRRFASGVGDSQSARKAALHIEQRPLTPAETFWAVSALRLLITRAGDHELNLAAVFSHVTMAELPLLHSRR